jgi:ubiquinone/menaquinone biosynthesis C-methylase UbiE
MDHMEVRRYWNRNADAWTKLARAGYDVYRDYLNTPAFFKMLPDVRGRSGLDIGCGEGHNTRLLAKRGARVTAIDISEAFIEHAKRLEEQEPLGINYQVASAVEMPFVDSTFDFATGFMSFMDIPETDYVLAEAYRVLKPDGFLQFSITHPCYDTPHRRNLRDENGLTYAIEVGDYFRNLQGDVTEWLFSAAPPRVKEGLPKFKVPSWSVLRNHGQATRQCASALTFRMLKLWPTSCISVRKSQGGALCLREGPAKLWSPGRLPASPMS